MEEKLLYSSTNNMEVDYVCSLLKENDIAYTKKTEGAGDYLTITAGNLFNYTTKIFVSDEQYEKANQLINNIYSKNEDTQNMEIPDELKNISNEEENEMNEKAKKTKENLKLFIVLFVFCPILIAVIVAIISSV